MTTTTDAERGFLSSIVAEPKDDTPRLVYADWLDEHAGTVPCPICRGPGFNRGGLGGPIGCTRCRGELAVSDGSRERAEFIRVQVELAKLRPAEIKSDTCTTCGSLPGEYHRDGCRYVLLRRREREILASHGLTWCDGLLSPEHRSHREDHDQSSVTVVYYWDLGWGNGHAERVRVGFRRGFPAGLEMTAECWLLHADAITAAQPVENVTLTTMPQVERRAGLDTYGLVGRPKQYVRVADCYSTMEEVKKCLKAEWPRIEFEVHPHVATGGVIHIPPLPPPSEFL